MAEEAGILDLLRLALTERDVTFDGEFFTVERPTTIATRPLQNPLPVWLGGASRETMQLAGQYGWNVMRNFGSNDEHRDALEAYRTTAAEHGHVRSCANMMIERFVAVGKRAVPATDGEFQVGRKNRPALIVAGTPEEVVDSLPVLRDRNATVAATPWSVICGDVRPRLDERPSQSETYGLVTVNPGVTAYAPAKLRCSPSLIRV